MRNAELLTRVSGGCFVAVLRGELDTADAECAAGAVAALTADGRRLVVDLGALEFMDCHAAGALLGVREAARQAGGDVLLAAPRGSVLRLLTVLGVSGVYVSVAAAVDGAGRRDRRGLRVIRTARSGRGLLPGPWSRRAARRAAVPEPRAGFWSWPARWLRGRAGLRG